MRHQLLKSIGGENKGGFIGRVEKRYEEGHNGGEFAGGRVDQLEQAFARRELLGGEVRHPGL